MGTVLGPPQQDPFVFHAGIGSATWPRVTPGWGQGTWGGAVRALASLPPKPLLTHSIAEGFGVVLASLGGVPAVTWGLCRDFGEPLPAQPCVGFVSHCVNEHCCDSASSAAWGAPALEQPPAPQRGQGGLRQLLLEFGGPTIPLGPAQNQPGFEQDWGSWSPWRPRVSAPLLLEMLGPLWEMGTRLAVPTLGGLHPQIPP